MHRRAMLYRLRAGTLQVIVPKQGQVAALAGDGQRAELWPWSRVSGRLKEHRDVFCPSGAEIRIESFNHEARVVHLGGKELSHTDHGST